MGETVEDGLDDTGSFLTAVCCRYYTVAHDAEQIHIRNKADRHGRQGDKLAPATAMAPSRPGEGRSRATSAGIYPHDRRHLGTP